MQAVIANQLDHARPRPIILTTEERFTAMALSVRAEATHNLKKDIYDYFVYNKNSYKRLKGIIKYLEKRTKELNDDKNIMAGV